jgi:hypothetical protein
MIWIVAWKPFIVVYVWCLDIYDFMYYVATGTFYGYVYACYDLECYDIKTYLLLFLMVYESSHIKFIWMPLLYHHHSIYIYDNDIWIDGMHTYKV